MATSGKVEVSNVTARARNKGGQEITGKAVLSVGGILTAIGASSCCVLPFVLFTLGISGAWIGNLTALAPYQPLFVAAALGFLGTGFWRAYRRPVACDGPARLVRGALWSATGLVIVAVAFPYIAPLLLS
ncbi:mercuric transporter MerT family protein [Inquilinus sp. CAU 1745]|uniref:mercuric transporter MerT family protein n=1 Tax=Inquilinus sp. CAU 1745 TaxID=3140369 RepID=UPI00325A9F02